MGGLFQPLAELVDVTDELAILRSSKRLNPGRALAVKLVTAHGRTSVRVVVRDTRPLSRGYASTVLLPDNLRLSSQDCCPRPAEGVRRDPRHDCHLRVLSPDLPGYRGVSVDFSNGGMQLETAAELKLGQTILLRVELDTPDFPALECSARVAWVARRGRRNVAHGLQFIDLTPDTRAVIHAFERHLLDRADMDIAQRVLG